MIIQSVDVKADTYGFYSDYSIKTVLTVILDILDLIFLRSRHKLNFTESLQAH